MRVRVYRNLKHGRRSTPLYSIMDLKTGRVIARRHDVLVADAQFVVSEKGRQRVLQDGRKNVHAFVEGLLCEYEPMSVDRLPTTLMYNPWLGGAFVIWEHSDADYYRIHGKYPPDVRAVAMARTVLLNGIGITAVL